MDPAVAAPSLLFTAAVHAISVHSVLFVQISTGKVLVCPSYLERGPKRDIFGCNWGGRGHLLPASFTSFRHHRHRQLPLCSTCISSIFWPPLP